MRKMNRRLRELEADQGLGYWGLRRGEDDHDHDHDRGEAIGSSKMRCSWCLWWWRRWRSESIGMRLTLLEGQQQQNIRVILETQVTGRSWQSSMTCSVVDKSILAFVDRIWCACALSYSRSPWLIYLLSQALLCAVIDSTAKRVCCFYIFHSHIIIQ